MKRHTHRRTDVRGQPDFLMSPALIKTLEAAHFCSIIWLPQ